MGGPQRAARKRPARDAAGVRRAIDAGSSRIVRDNLEASAICGSRRRHSLPRIGDRFGKLTLTGFVTGERRGLAACVVQCACGAPEHFVVFDTLRNGSTLRCDACSRRQQNLTRKAYWGYADVVPDDDHRARLLNRIPACISRCHNSTDKGFKHYGGRGIAVHEPWRTDRRSFLMYLVTLDGWENPQLELDRIKNERGYEPGNLRFLSRAENMLNRRTVHALQARVDELEAENADLRSRLRRAEQSLHREDA